MRTACTQYAVVILSLALVATGCSEAGPPSAPTPPAPSIDLPFVLTGIVRESGTRAPVPDVNVCWYDEKCVLTKPDGSYRLDGPHRSAGGHIDECPFVYGADFEIRQNCLMFTYPESPWSPTVQRVIRIDAGQSVQATVFADDISGLQGEDYCVACKRIRVMAGRDGLVTVRITPESGLRVSFAYTDQQLNEPFLVKAGQDSPIIVANDNPGTARSFQVSTTFDAR